MFLNVRAAPRASRNFVKQVNNNTFRVYITKPAQEGEANKEVIETLADYLGVKKYRIRIVKGDRARDKVIEVTDG